MADEKVYWDGIDISGSLASFEFTESAKEKLATPRLDFGGTIELEYEGGDMIDKLWDMMMKDHVRKQNYAVSLCLMNGFGCIEVQYGDFTEWYMAPRVPYRQLMKMPYEAFDVLDKMTYGARRIEV